MKAELFFKGLAILKFEMRWASSFVWSQEGVFYFEEEKIEIVSKIEIWNSKNGSLF